MAQAARKGPAGIQWLKRGGAGHKYVVRVRLGARILKNLRMERPQQLITELAKKYSGLRKALWAGTILAILVACFSFVESSRKFYGAQNRLPSGSNTEETAQQSGSRDGAPTAHDP